MSRRPHIWAALLALAIVVPLIGASSGFAAPVVVIYPITSSGAIEASAGGNLALIIATKLTQLGGVTIKPPTPGTERAKFLDAANASGADYYVTGFLTPIGADNSLITQVVSTHSGSVVFSTTGIVRTYEDALAQVDALHSAILRHAGRGLAALDAPPPPPSRSPPPVANEGSVDIGKALHKRRRGHPASSATPTARPSSLPSAPAPGAPATRSAALPSATASAVAGATQAAKPAVVAARPATRAALLFVVDGPLQADVAAQATTAIARALTNLGRPTAIMGITLGTNLRRAAAICAASPGTAELDAATMVVGQNDTGAARVQLDLSSYDCAGTALGTQRAMTTATARGAAGLHDAIARAATAATKALTAR